MEKRSKTRDNAYNETLLERMSSMSRQLWLFRHGIAEKKSSSKNDAERTLTKQGRKEVERSAPHLRYLLDLKKPVYLWSSPLTRALQTAEILAESLGNSDIIQKEFIAAGDLKLLLQELEKMPETCTVIIVGHEPSLSDWAESLIGASLPFGKGSCACFNMQETASADLLWFHQSESLQTLGTFDNTDTFKLKLLLQQHLKEAQSKHVGFLNDPADPETTHQLRVELRHLRSMLSFLKPLLTETVYNEAKVPLKDAFHQFSYLRELDILIEEIKRIDELEPELIKETEKVVETVTAAREKEKSRLIHSSNQSKIRTVLDKLWDWTESVDWFPIVLEVESFAQFAAKKIGLKHKKLKKQLKKMDSSDATEVHQARIETKKYRYILTDFAPLLEDDHKKNSKQAKKIQNKLSSIPDLQHNLYALEGFIDNTQGNYLNDPFTAIYEYEKEQLDKQLADLKENTPRLK